MLAKFANPQRAYVAMTIERESKVQASLTVPSARGTQAA